MSTLVILSFLTWGVATGCAVLSLAGNPVYRLFRKTPEPVLRAALATFDTEDLERADDEVVDFIRALSRWLLVLLALFMIELGLCLYFVSQRPGAWLCWFVLAKDALAAGVSYLLVRRRQWRNPLAAMVELPPWVRRWERVNYFLSAVCFGVLFLVVNELL